MSAAPQLAQRSVTPARAAAARPAPVRINVSRSAVLVASSLRVSSPHDAAEVEAVSTARQVMAMATPAVAPASAGKVGPGSGIARLAGPIVQRASATARLLQGASSPHAMHIQRAGNGPAAADVGAELAADSGGAPLAGGVKRFMEPRFGTRFDAVRVHTGSKAADLSRRINARAFTVGNRVYFGAGQYRPETAEGKELIAHELTHTIQQGAVPATAATRGTAPTLQRSVDVQQRVGREAQRGWLPDPWEYLAGKAAAIPGFTMLTVVIGFNPITRSKVDRSAGNILRGAIEMIPGGFLITQALANHGIFDKVSAWAASRFEALREIGGGIWQAIKDFIAGFSLSDLANLSGLWERGKRIFTGPIDAVIAFARDLKDGIVALIKEAILKPIAAFARGTNGYPLLCAVMGRDPITGEAVPQDAESLMGAFMKFIGATETWETMKKANAIPRAFAWFKGAMQALMGFVTSIPGLFVTAFKSLEIMDIVLIPRAFLKLGKVFLGFAGRFVSWGLEAVWNLLEIIFDVVKPGIMGYVKRTGAALKSILKNPLPFVGNLVNAAKQGFLQFSRKFGQHLKAGLIEWLTGSLPGVYIPASFELKEIVKFVLSVLGLTWQNLRGKLVKVVGEPAVKAMETGFDIVVTLVRDGPAAAWAKIKEQLGNLKDMVIGGITDLVVGIVVQQAIPKLIAMFIPGAGFITAILAIYDTVMVFVQKLAKIAAVVGAFVNSIVAIAAGNIAAAANRVESVLAGLLSLAISFLAGFAGLGKVADKVLAVITKIRAPIDKAMDAVIAWVVTMAKKLFAKALGKDQADERTPAQKQTDLNQAIAEAEALQAAPKASEASIRKGLGKIKTKYRMKSLELVVEPVKDGKERVHTVGEINPKKESQYQELASDGTVGPLGIVREDLSWKADTLKELLKDPIWNKFTALKGKYQEAGLAIRHRVSISDTIKNTDAALQPKTPDDAAAMLAAKKYPVDGSPKTKPKIVASARALLQDANNDLSNLFVGDAHINSTVVKERYDFGDANGASANDQAEKDHREDFVEQWGFKDEEFVITLTRKSKRLGTSLTTETRKSKGSRDVVPAAA